jgi:hypothetical protein
MTVMALVKLTGDHNGRVKATLMNNMSHDISKIRGGRGVAIMAEFI